jgi:hypothetical protein
MQRLMNKQVTPHGGWRFHEKDTDTLVKGAHWSDLVSKVLAHREANQLPTDPGYEEEIEAYMCQEVEDSCEELPDPPKAAIGINEIISFTKIMVESFLRGNPRVDTEEATRRGKICSECRDNVEAAGCRPCNSKAIAAFLKRTGGPVDTLYDGKLKSCRHCGCFNVVQIWFPLEILKNNQRAKVQEALPEHCWKK